jgi:hypothetical protein
VVTLECKQEEDLYPLVEAQVVEVLLDHLVGVFTKINFTKKEKNGRMVVIMSAHALMVPAESTPALLYVLHGTSHRLVT